MRRHYVKIELETILTPTSRSARSAVSTRTTQIFQVRLACVITRMKTPVIFYFILPEIYIAGNALAFYGGGTNAIGRNVMWHLLNCAANPDTVQRKIQEEIDNVVGKERSPAWEDHFNMPYTMAVMEEMHRWRPVSPIPLPRG